MEDEDQLVYDRDAGHLVGSDASDHDIVEHADEICDRVLDQDRQHDHQQMMIKFFGSD